MTDQNQENPGRQVSKRPPMKTPDVIPDTLVVPENTIYMCADDEAFTNPTYFEKCQSKRSWFTSFFYNCLPIVFGNQHGFILKATNPFVVRWNGLDDVDGVAVHMLEEPGHGDLSIESHFGSGILTVQSRFTLRTPKSVNLMVKAPPNYFVHGFAWMDAVVETDSLRRDFTFNIKITRPQIDIYVPKGTPLGCILPYPRFFLDKYEMVELKDPVERQKAIKTICYFAQERADFDYNHPRLRYMEGKDIYDIHFDEHQKTLDSGEWWQSNQARHERENASKGCPVKPHEQPAAKPDHSAVAPNIVSASKNEPKPAIKKFKKNRKRK